MSTEGQSTQFQPGNREQSKPGANKPWSIRHAVRRAAAQVNKNGRAEAEDIAQKVMEMAKAGDMRAVEYITEQVDGKLPQTNINADLDRLAGLSEEDLRAEQLRIAREIAELESAINGDSVPHAQAEAGQAGTIAESTPAQSPADAGQVSMPGHPQTV